VRPAQQGLDARELTVDGVDDRLIFDVQLVALAGAGQAALSSPVSAIPTLAVTGSSTLERSNGSDSARFNRRAISSQSPQSSRSSHSTRNSSADKRDTLSPGRRNVVSRSATAISSSSPIR
jgi:hypothetical protein